MWTLLADIAVHDLALKERTTHALYDAFLAREVTNRYYRSLADVSDVTASHDLGKLVASGLLVPRGAGRAARYVRTEQLVRAVAHRAGVDEDVTAGAPFTEQRDAVLAALAGHLGGAAG